MNSVMPLKGWYADEHEFIGKLTKDASKASRFGKFSATVSSGGEVRIPARGDSIHGTRKGDVLVFGKCQWEGTQPGDILLYRSGERVLAHRVVRTSFNGDKYVFVTKSDTARHLDPPVDPDQILGKLKSVEREGKVLPASRVRGSLLYRFTEYGTRSIVEKVLDMVLTPIPRSLRPTTWYRDFREKAPGPAGAVHKRKR